MNDIVALLNGHYPMRFDRADLMRDMGSTSYIAYASAQKYFVRAIKPALADTAIVGADIQLFLQKRAFLVPPIVLTQEGSTHVNTGEMLFIVYQYIEGSDCDPERDAEAIGALTGRLHREMRAYPSALVKRDEQFYIGRYIDVLKRKHYPRTDEYVAYGAELWEQIKNLPRGYCHGDLYDGNIRKAQDGKLYVHDFDTCCEGIMMYDPTLICNMTAYFDFDTRNYQHSNRVLARFVPEYRQHSPLSEAETEAFHALIAVQHFATQATIMALFGDDCIDAATMDKQLKWLYRWRQQVQGRGI